MPKKNVLILFDLLEIQILLKRLCWIFFALLCFRVFISQLFLCCNLWEYSFMRLKGSTCPCLFGLICVLQIASEFHMISQKNRTCKQTNTGCSWVSCCTGRDQEAAADLPRVKHKVVLRKPGVVADFKQVVIVTRQPWATYKISQLLLLQIFN